MRDNHTHTIVTRETPVTSDQTENPRLLIVDDKESMRSLLHAAMSDKGWDLTTAADGAEAIALIRKTRFNLVITDLNMPKFDGIDVLRAAKEADADMKVIVVTAFGTMETAVEAMRLGASDFIAKPFAIEEIELKAAKLMPRGPSDETALPFDTPLERPLVGDSLHTKDLLQMIKKVGPSKSAVLITGPTGTGKELVARALHQASPLRERPFVALNCAALASGVLESELFGHEKGAFTGAVSTRIGRFEQAHTGTLFLDEVGDIDPSIQTKLLRVLQENEIERVGGHESIHVDVRIVAATNRDLKQAIADGDFREDFYYRLNVFSLEVAPLAERPEDLPALTAHFLKKFSAETGKQVTGLDPEVSDIFGRYAWPGNVRELENVLERAVVLADGTTISSEELPRELVLTPYQEPALTDSDRQRAAQPAGTLGDRTDTLESDAIREALEKFRWNKSKAAEHLGLKRTTLQYKIKKYGLE
jgi:two-component system NtrC family response regulator